MRAVSAASRSGSSISTAALHSAPNVATWSTSWNASRPRNGARDLADERDQRCRVLTRRVQGDGQIRGADGARGHDQGGPTGQLAVRLGHEAGAAFVAGGDRPDRRVVERVEDAHEALARDRERVLDPGRGEGLDDGSAAGRFGSGHDGMVGRASVRRPAGGCPGGFLLMAGRGSCAMLWP